MSEYHYGITIREGRKKLKMTQAQLAEKWPQPSGESCGVSVNYVSDVERGIKKITNPQTLRNLCNILQIPLWKMGLSEFDPFASPETEQTQFLYNGLTKLTDSANDRISDFKVCLLESEGDCFISGTSMIHLAEDSGYLLEEKLNLGKVYLLILDPDWIEQNSSILTFIQDEQYRQQFHYEIRNSIYKLNQIRESLSPKLTPRFQIKTYRTIFPYIMTGFDNGETGRLVVEITDYLPENHRPRFTLHKNHIFYEQVKNKFFSLWHNKSLTKEI